MSRRTTPFALALSLICVGILTALPAMARKGITLTTGDDPSIGERTAVLVLVEVADFQ